MKLPLFLFFSYSSEEFSPATASSAPVHGILQARTLEWVAISSSNA